MTRRKRIIALIRRTKLPLFLRKISRLLGEASIPLDLTIGDGTLIEPPLYCGNPHRIRIGANCHIGAGCDFGVVGSKNAKGSGKDGEIVLGDRVWITARATFYSGISIIVEDDCMLAAGVFVVDYTHGYARAEIPYQHQPFESFSPVVIGRGSWLGQNVVVLQGVRIGEMCIIGANSVVTAEIPPFSIAVGSPARVVKSWNAVSGNWEKPS